MSTIRFDLEAVLAGWAGELTAAEIDEVRTAARFAAVVERDAGYILAALVVGAMDRLHERHSDGVGLCLYEVAERFARLLLAESRPDDVR